ncbi:MAG: arylesterase [Candidatus Doudnabacteria bacterium]|nr:arylesterase [Candidatus Doudnabacteria bacterium]
MKIVYLVLAGLALVSITFFVFHQKSADYPVPTVGTNIIVFGDSLAFSQGSTENHDLASLLSQKLGLPVINSGVSGDTTVSAAPRVPADVLAHDPKIVIILLGGNDFFHQIPPAQTMTALRSIVESIQAKGAGIILINENKSFATADMFEALAKEKNIPYMENIMGGIINRRELMSDAIHPNDAGYEIMAEKITLVIEDYLK